MINYLISLQPILPTAAVCGFCWKSELNADELNEQLGQLQQQSLAPPTSDSLQHLSNQSFSPGAFLVCFSEFVAFIVFSIFYSFFNFILIIISI